MHLSTLKAKHTRKHSKRVGRGGKRGTTSGAGTKGQKSRAGASVRSGFRGGDNRMWQLFPKQRGAGKKPGNKSPHRKHRFFVIKRYKPWEINLRALNIFKDGDIISASALAAKNLVPEGITNIKLLASGTLKRKLTVEGLMLSASAKQKIEQAGGTVVA